jgi:hypothetical protein
MSNSIMLCALVLMGSAVFFGLMRMILDTVNIFKNPVVDRTHELEFYRKHRIDPPFGGDF